MKLVPKIEERPGFLFSGNCSPWKPSYENWHKEVVRILCDMEWEPAAAYQYAVLLRPYYDDYYRSPEAAIMEELSYA